MKSNGLINTIEISNSAGKPYYFIELNPSKTLDLILDTQRLDNLLETDNYVYQKIYYKIPDNIIKATITYGFNGTKE